MERAQLIIELHGIILSLITTYLMVRDRKNWGHREPVMLHAIICNIIILVNDILAIIYRGNMSGFGRFIIPLSNFLVYFFQYAVVWLICDYADIVISEYVPESGKLWKHLVKGIGILLYIGLVLTPATGLYYYIDENNLYHRGSGFMVAIILSFVMAIMIMIKVWSQYKELDRSEMLYLNMLFIFPATGLVLQVFLYGISLINIGYTISIAVVILTYENKHRQHRIEVEKVLLQSRAYLLNSQIKPHFVFNSLSVISVLIDDDPELAKEAISHFSKYMRRGLNLNVNEGMIPIREELDYAEHYLYMEQLRFGRKLQVDWDIDEGLSFDIPFLTVQPLVENAVRHGVRKKLEGGTVTIQVAREGFYDVVRVSDDGVGFDVAELRRRQASDARLQMGIVDSNAGTRNFGTSNSKAGTVGASTAPDRAKDFRANAAEKGNEEGSRKPGSGAQSAEGTLMGPTDNTSNGIGIFNVEERIRLLANGKMEIESTPGQGTTITMRFPVKKK